MSDTILVVAVVTAGLVAGQMLAIGLANHADRAQAASDWIRRFQFESGLFSKTMPPAMAVPILSLAMSTFLSAGSERILLGVALALMAAALAITLSMNVPINGQIGSWRAESPPGHWASTRDRWLRAHWARTAIAVVGFVVVAVAARLG